MCSSKTNTSPSPTVNGRPVLHPNCNRVSLLETRNSQKSLLPLPSSTTKTNPKANLVSPPVSPKLNSPAERTHDPIALPRNTSPKSVAAHMKKSKKRVGGGPEISTDSFKFSSSLIVEAPGSIAAARREQVAIMQVQRKMKIAHYGRTKSARYLGQVVPLDSSAAAPATAPEEKRCSFITSNSDPIYVAYHDEEWGVPVRDDNLLFELLVLTGAQVGSDWTSVLKKRKAFREAFSGFDAETVSKYTEKKINSISADYCIELSQVRGVVDNAKRILEMKKAMGSFSKYLWGFVNNKPIATHYKSCHRIPVKTSKSESMSKDMVRRGFRLVGPTVMHSFMQAAGLTNDHLLSCPRHLQCLALASPTPSAPAF